MPQLELDELRLLADIQSSIAPLIAKRLSDDFRTGEISSLAVYNPLFLFVNGVLSIPVYLASEREFTPEASRLFNQHLIRLLGLLESFVREDVIAEKPQEGARTSGSHASHGKVLEPEAEFHPQFQATSAPEASDYPKLEALTKRVSQSSQSESSDHSRFLLLPKTAEGAETANQIITEFNDSNYAQAPPQRNNTAFRSTADSGPYKPRLKTAENQRNYLQNLWNALKRNMSTSGCNSPHLAKIQIRHPGDSVSRRDDIDDRIFISCCLVPGKWQQTTCNVISNLPRDSTFKNVKNICKVIRGSINDGKTLKIVVHDRGIVRDLAAAEYIQLPPVLPTISLDAILRDNNQSLRPYHKIILALNLSHTLSRVYNRDMKDEWTSSGIYFLFNQTNCAVHEAYNPYVPYSLCRQEETDDTGLTGTRKFPLLVAFGKLLLEIALGRVLEEVELNIHPRADLALGSILAQQEDELEESVPSGYNESMRECFQANHNDDYDDESDDEEELDEEAQVRGVLSTIINHLEADRKSFRGPSRTSKAKWDDPNFPRELKISGSILRQRSSVKAPKPPTSATVFPKAIIPNLVLAEPLTQMFDGKKGDIKGTDEKAILAETFMDLVEDFRSSHIEELCTIRRIRIAILDTGVDESNLFIRSACKAMRKQRGHYPFKEIKSFVGGSGLDEFGHGTNVASLMLKVAPEADFYIAKISQSKEVANKSRIAQAIHWARECGVDIINMSFGMSDDCPEIENAIKQAENENIILFAAASNYGGNQRRAFPARMDKVLCVHSSDGDGTTSGFNPTPKAGHDNFSTLGEAIESVWEYGAYLSGTSYATPVVAGFAANILQYVRCCPLLHEKHREKAFSRAGMQSILVAMSEKRGEFLYIAPWRKMWALEEGDTKNDIAFRIKQALKDDR